ncbi:hypothetical protein [Streptomyces agglomeratus]|uniref:hypothetical protein n=1 Tax=Streptomyces agglomeratus TaxID=285458 RepID=UPI00114C9D5A|nr:hypothetical protein [Streptomyces agglomeratus]
MKKSPLVGAAAALCALLTGCSSDDGSDVSRTERDTAKAYVAALNARDADALAKLGEPGYEGVKKDASEIIAADGGRDLKVKSVQVTHDFGPDVASAHVTATDDRGKPFSTYIQMSRSKDVWVVALGQAPGFGKDGKTPASTSTPK